MRLENLSAQPAPSLSKWFTVSSYLCSHSLVSSLLSLNLTVETYTTLEMLPLLSPANTYGAKAAKVHTEEHVSFRLCSVAC